MSHPNQNNKMTTSGDKGTKKGKSPKPFHKRRKIVLGGKECDKGREKSEKSMRKQNPDPKDFPERKMVDLFSHGEGSREGMKSNRSDRLRNHYAFYKGKKEEKYL